MNGISSFCGVGCGTAATALTGAIGVKPRIGVLRRGARQDQHRHEMHDAAQQRASEQPQQTSGSLSVFHSTGSHEHDCASAGIGASRAARVATPTG